MENLFNHILDDDEKIVKIIKPHKGKYYLSNMLGFALTYLIFALMVLVPIVTDEEIPNVAVLIPIGLFVVAYLLTWLFLVLYYKNNYYAYTNKRIVIRSGVFGVDYKSLDMAMIGIVNVYVSVLDKIFRKNTGTLTFGSVATKEGVSYRFADIHMPYETCKEVKSAIDKYKQKHLRTTEK